MKTLLIAAAMMIVCGIRLWAQEQPLVSIKLYDEERFRFEGNRLSFHNTGLNVCIGDSAGAEGLNFRHNVYIGYQAGSHDTAGQYNVYLGAFSGRLETTGVNNTYIGYLSGRFSDSTYSNTFVGSLSGHSNTRGKINTFIGRRAGNFNTTGSENTFLGQAAGYANTTGSFNTYVGRLSGANNQEGNNNIFIGYYAGTNDNASNRLVISNRDTTGPLVYGEFDTRMFRLNAERMEIKNALKNTIIGDSSGISTTGSGNVFVGYHTGLHNTTGGGNVFIGDSTGTENTTGSGNVFIGGFAGWLNTTAGNNVFIGSAAGMKNNYGGGNTVIGTTAGFNLNGGQENVLVGMSSGAGLTNGNSNTFIGRGAGWNNQTGDSNVFIGYRAGAGETTSSKLYIANKGGPPLIYGDFAQKTLTFNAMWVKVDQGSLHASHEIETDWHYVAAGKPGVTDTVNTITNFDFEQQKLKYRTTVYTGGIITFLSLESEWVDAIGGYLTPCGEIGLVGEFNNWTDDVWMRRNDYNYDQWTLTLKLTIDDDQSVPVDSIVEMKFREDADWAVSWGSTSFPSGTGTNQYGSNIPAVISSAEDTTVYYIEFNCRSGAYDFYDLTGYCGDSITDPRDGKKYATVLIGNQCWMAQDLNVGTRVDGGTVMTNDGNIQKYCYENQESNCTLWGGLYPWQELMAYSTTPGTQGICPAGWHVPTDEEFKILEGNVDSQFGPGSKEWDKIGWRGYDAGKNLMATSGWGSGGIGTDAFGFHAVPGGIYSETAGFDGGGCVMNYQTSDNDGYGTPVIRHLNCTFPEITRNTNNANDGCTLRCVKD